jgi:hypothetical protein
MFSLHGLSEVVVTKNNQMDLGPTFLLPLKDIHLEISKKICVKLLPTWGKKIDLFEPFPAVLTFHPGPFFSKS